MAVYEKHFTLEEARRELPELRRLFARILELVAGLQAEQVEVARIQERIGGNGHAAHFPDDSSQTQELQSLVAQIMEKGIEIKDLARGLVDFPHLRRGEEVYLCWLYGEEDILYWHTLEGGFAGRQPL
ncbi:MAG TPA: DUF2203 domain-containing protein [Chthonomonadaceae bacterium]|nr:DUF2203 domain-containing protein [Chthonomonadaceae bacterium]